MSCDLIRGINPESIPIIVDADSKCNGFNQYLLNSLGLQLVIIHDKVGN